MAQKKSTLQNKTHNVLILETLTKIAERLGLTSNQAILLYAANNFWTNLEHTQLAIGRLEKIAEAHNVTLNEREPYLFQLVKWGVILPDEAVIFGYAKPVESPTGKPQAESQQAIGANGSTEA